MMDPNLLIQVAKYYSGFQREQEMLFSYPHIFEQIFQ